MAKSIAEERIPARIPAAVYEKIQEAAQSVGATLNQFLVQSALEKANVIMKQERGITLSTATAKGLFDLVDNPSEPNETLKTAMQRRKDLSCR